MTLMTQPAAQGAPEAERAGRQLQRLRMLMTQRATQGTPEAEHAGRQLQILRTLMTQPAAGEQQ